MAQAHPKDAQGGGGAKKKLCFEEHKTPYEKLGGVTRELFEEHFSKF